MDADVGVGVGSGVMDGVGEPTSAVGDVLAVGFSTFVSQPQQKTSVMARANTNTTRRLLFTFLMAFSPCHRAYNHRHYSKKPIPRQGSQKRFKEK
jgi:hypothetical protein